MWLWAVRVAVGVLVVVMGRKGGLFHATLVLTHGEVELDPFTTIQVVHMNMHS